ncbi:uncharacterized protein [Littorina saxatilis]|uniref:Uncharacterized protein n=1 Tax=Littorina saxatilis TaxID=31220 RepID=A0AAN9B8P5_9CAEN
MSKSHSGGDAPPSHSSVTNAAVHQSWEQQQPSCNSPGPSQGFSGPTSQSHSQYTGAGPSTSHTALGSSHHHHHNGKSSSGEGSELRHYTYCAVQREPSPVRGGYLYSNSQGMVPTQTAPVFQTPFARDRKERMAAIRRHEREKKCYIRVGVVLGLVTVIALIVAFVLRNTLIIGFHAP